MQDTVFVPTLSAWETLHFSAVLRTPSGVPRADIKRRMEDTLAVMGLSRVAHTQVQTLTSYHLLSLHGCAAEHVRDAVNIAGAAAHTCRGYDPEGPGNMLFVCAGGRAACRRHPCERPQWWAMLLLLVHYLKASSIHAVTSVGEQ